MKTINLFFDMEFTSLSPDAQPISLGIVSEELSQRFDRSPTGIIKAIEYSVNFGIKVDDWEKYKECLTENVIYFLEKVDIKSFLWDKYEDFKKENASLGKYLLVDFFNSLNTSKSFYSEFSDFDLNRCDDWVKENVVSKLKYNSLEMLSNSPDNAKYGNVSIKGDTNMVKSNLQHYLNLLSIFNIQFICDCGTFDWYHLLQLIGKWDFKCWSKIAENEFKTKISSSKIGLPNLPTNTSPVPQDLNYLIALKQGISVREAFDLNREELAGAWTESVIEFKHNSLWDAKVIKAIYKKLTK